MPEKIKKNLLGRTVTKTSGVNSSGVEFKKKTVTKPDGEFVRSKVKTKEFITGGARTLKRRETGKSIKEKIKHDYVGSKSEVTKNKYAKGLSNGTQVLKQTRKGPSGTSRSVDVKKPGEKFKYAGMGVVSQGKAYRYQTKKNK